MLYGTRDGGRCRECWHGSGRTGRRYGGRCRESAHGSVRTCSRDGGSCRQCAHGSVRTGSRDGGSCRECVHGSVRTGCGEGCRCRERTHGNSYTGRWSGCGSAVDWRLSWRCTSRPHDDERSTMRARRSRRNCTKTKCNKHSDINQTEKKPCSIFLQRCITSSVSMWSSKPLWCASLGFRHLNLMLSLVSDCVQSGLILFSDSEVHACSNIFMMDMY